jgi:hypothetical protein
VQQQLHPEHDLFFFFFLLLFLFLLLESTSNEI